jgi:hypothetical protein
MVGIAGGRVWATAFQEGLAITAVNCRGCDEPGDGVEPVIDCVAGGRRFAVLWADGAPWLEVFDRRSRRRARSPGSRSRAEMRRPA